MFRITHFCMSRFVPKTPSNSPVSSPREDKRKSREHLRFLDCPKGEKCRYNPVYGGRCPYWHN